MLDSYPDCLGSPDMLDSYPDCLGSPGNARLSYCYDTHVIAQSYCSEDITDFVNVGGGNPVMMLAFENIKNLCIFLIERVLKKRYFSVQVSQIATKPLRRWD